MWPIDCSKSHHPASIYPSLLSVHPNHHGLCWMWEQQQCQEPCYRPGTWRPLVSHHPQTSHFFLGGQKVGQVWFTHMLPVTFFSMCFMIFPGTKARLTSLEFPRSPFCFFEKNGCSTFISLVSGDLLGASQPPRGYRGFTLHGHAPPSGAAHLVFLSHGSSRLPSPWLLAHPLLVISILHLSL